MTTIDPYPSLQDGVQGGPGQALRSKPVQHYATFLQAFPE
jgi:hypothetical protein